MKYLDLYINHIKSSRTGLTEDQLLERCQKECPDMTLETLRSYTSKMFTSGILLKNGSRIVMHDEFINKTIEEIKTVIHAKDKKERRKSVGRRKEDTEKGMLVYKNLDTLKIIDTVASMIKKIVVEASKTEKLESEVDLKGSNCRAVIKGKSLNIECKISVD